MELEDEVQNDLKRATGEITKESEGIRKLNRVLQLTGFSDPVYAEAYVTVHQVGFGRAGEKVCPAVVCKDLRRVVDRQSWKFVRMVEDGCTCFLSWKTKLLNFSI